jgi:hypothetical protein
MYAADTFCVSLYSHCHLACNFVHLCTLLQLPSSTRFLFLHSYMQHDYYQQISYQCMMSYAGSLAIVLCCVRLYVC